MINSMTGYGEAEGQIQGVDYVVEIKAVNNRYLRTSIKLPDCVAFLEEHIERFLREELTRGTISYTLRMKGIPSDALFDIDEHALRDVAGRLDKIRVAANLQASIDLGKLLDLPGIVRPASPSGESVELLKTGILAISKQAMDRLQQMRAAEGRFMEEDLDGHCQAIENDLNLILARREVVVHEYAQRLKRRVDELLAQAKLKLDEETLAREVAILADRSDIAEELSRLDSHLHQFENACKAEDDQAGRRLDFISQEMLREANTIGSKASDIEICQRVVEIKCRIDRIKEQVQNVE